MPILPSLLELTHFGACSGGYISVAFQTAILANHKKIPAATQRLIKKKVILGKEGRGSCRKSGALTGGFVHDGPRGVVEPLM